MSRLDFRHGPGRKLTFVNIFPNEFYGTSYVSVRIDFVVVSFSFFIMSGVVIASEVIAVCYIFGFCKSGQEVFRRDVFAFLCYSFFFSF